MQKAEAVIAVDLMPGNVSHGKLSSLIWYSWCRDAEVGLMYHKSTYCAQTTFYFKNHFVLADL